LEQYEEDIDSVPGNRATTPCSEDIFRPNYINNLKYNLDPNPNPNQDQDLNIDNYMVSQNALTPYSSDGVVSLMREVSGNHTLGQDELQDEPQKKLTLETP
jgi:hypothetical protein